MWGVSGCSRQRGARHEPEAPGKARVPNTLVALAVVVNVRLVDVSRHIVRNHPRPDNAGGVEGHEALPVVLVGEEIRDGPLKGTKPEVIRAI